MGVLLSCLTVFEALIWILYDTDFLVYDSQK